MIDSIVFIVGFCGVIGVVSGKVDYCRECRVFVGWG